MPITNALFNYPKPNKEKYQRSVDINDLFLYRLSPPWARPSTLPVNMWRQWVLNQPVAMVCRETLIATILSMDWKITPRDSKYRDELEGTIKYYTNLISRGGEYDALQLDYSGLVEWIVGDLLDTPFGGAAELGRRGNSPDGRVVWIRPLDSATLYPTLNNEYPTVQYYMQYEAVAFPKGFLARTYMSPHSMIWREGWGMAPPEKIYFAINMLNKGDKYYANLLDDVPTAGILDLGDMEKGAAEDWINAFKTFVADVNQSFRIPVLYEHNNPINFLPFGKVPNDIMFDRIMLKYSALTAAAYGMSLSDIGLQTTSASGETLAGSIRQERRTKKTGIARVKAKVKAFFDSFLPPTIEWNFVDYDDELNVALGRARLATGQAFTAFRQMGLFSNQELRSQAIQDGLVSISLPDQLPPDAEPDPTQSPNATPGLLQGGKAPSAGGEGEVKSLDSVSFKPKSRVLNNIISKLTNEVAPKIVENIRGISEDDVAITRSLIGESIFSESDNLEVAPLLAKVIANKSIGTIEVTLDDVKKFVEDEGIDYDGSWDALASDFWEDVNKSLPDYLGRTILFMLNEEIFLQNGFDTNTELDYNYIVKQVQEKVTKSLPDFVKIHVGFELENMLRKIKGEV
jgi:hypothetical protein